MNLKTVNIFDRHGTGVTDSMFSKASIIVDDLAVGQSPTLLWYMESCLGADTWRCRQALGSRISLTAHLVL